MLVHLIQCVHRVSITAQNNPHKRQHWHNFTLATKINHIICCWLDTNTMAFGRNEHLMWKKSQFLIGLLNGMCNSQIRVLKRLKGGGSIVFRIHGLIKPHQDFQMTTTRDCRTYFIWWECESIMKTVYICLLWKNLQPNAQCRKRY